MLNDRCFLNINAELIHAKINAFLLHLLVTTVLAGAAAWVIFWVWYPGALAHLIGGADLFKLIIVVELCLGPLMSLVIFNPKKPKSELIRDYVLVGIIQFLALSYGVYSTYISRPIFNVFVVDRIELVSSVELMDSDFLMAIDEQFNFRPSRGIKTVCVTLPTDEHERSDLLLSALDGKDIELMPKYYRSCGESELMSAAHSAAALIDILEINNQKSDAESLRELGDFKWLPVKSRFGAWVEIYPTGDYNQRFYKEINPFILN